MPKKKTTKTVQTSVNVKDRIVSYKPLIVVLSAIFIAALAINYRSPIDFMHNFMGVFFIIFAMFKFFDLEGFVEGFSMYDLITQKYRNYGYAYPFLELLLGVLYLSGTALLATDLATLALMCLSAAGVTKALGAGMDVRCACLGTTLNVPLSTISVIENGGMGLMALMGLLA